MGTINNLLLDEHPLLVMPTLATLIGLNESIVLQQVHYWLKTKEKTEQDYIDGPYWVYNSYERWQNLSRRTPTAFCSCYEQSHRGFNLRF